MLDIYKTTKMSGPRALSLPIYVVDAFTSRPFSGNPAAVCLCLPGCHLPDTLRQQIAAEMNHSETAFIEPVVSSILGMMHADVPVIFLGVFH